MDGKWTNNKFDYRLIIKVIYHVKMWNICCVSLFSIISIGIKNKYLWAVGQTKQTKRGLWEIVLWICGQFINQIRNQKLEKTKYDSTITIIVSRSPIYHCLHWFNCWLEPLQGWMEWATCPVSHRKVRLGTNALMRERNQLSSGDCPALTHRQSHMSRVEARRNHLPVKPRQYCDIKQGQKRWNVWIILAAECASLSPSSDKLMVLSHTVYLKVH